MYFCKRLRQTKTSGENTSIAGFCNQTENSRCFCQVVHNTSLNIETANLNPLRSIYASRYHLNFSNKRSRMYRWRVTCALQIFVNNCSVTFVYCAQIVYPVNMFEMCLTMNQKHRYRSVNQHSCCQVGYDIVYNHVVLSVYIQFENKLKFYN